MIKYILIFLCLWTSTISSFGQSSLPKNEYDSLMQIWNSSEANDSLKFLAIHRISWKGFLYTLPDSAFYYAQQRFDYADKLLSKTTDKNKRTTLIKQQAAAKITQGVAKRIKLHFQEALTFYLKADSLYSSINDTIGNLTSLGSIAVLYSMEGNYAKAIEMYTKTLLLAEELNNKPLISNTLSNIGNIYKDIKDFEKAINYYQKSLDLRIQLDDKIGIATSTHNLGMIYYDMNNFVKALEYYFQSCELNKEIGEKEGFANSNTAIAHIYKEQGKYEEAKVLYEESKKIQEEISDMNGLLHTLNGLASLYILKNDYKQAQSIALYTYQLAKENNLINLIAEAAKYLYESHKNLNQHKDALAYYEIHILYKDSLTNESTQKDIYRQEMSYEFEKEQLIKQQQEQEQARIEQEEKERRDNIQYSLIFLGILLVFGAVLGSGKFNISPKFAEGLIFFAFLIFFEFCLVLLDPLIDNWSSGEPIYKLLFNAVLAGAIFPLHAFFERVLKKKVINK
jgi:tetratricopeptide (TPR) repeat protein